MNARLVLITSNHPHVYTGGEVVFIAPELHRLARELGRVTVVPLHAEGATVDLPRGVDLDRSLSQALRNAGWLAYLRAFGWPGFGSELRRALRNGGWTGCARVWRWAAVADVTWRWARAAFPAGAPVLFYTYWRGGSTLALARLARERPDSGVVTRAHRFELYEDAFHPPFQPWHPALYHALQLTTAISQHGLDYLKRAGVPDAKLALHRLGTEPAPHPARASTDDTLRVVSCSNATAVKRVARIADAVLAFVVKHPDHSVHWTHFGDGPELGRVRARLRDAPANLASNLPGAVANRVVFQHYASEPVDVFLLLSASEGLPVSIQEAASASVPLIATDVGGVRELVGDDNGVLLAPDPAPAEVVQALEQVLLDPDPVRRQARREASLRRWAEGFDAEANHTRFARRLRALLGSLQSSQGTRGPNEV